MEKTLVILKPDAVRRKLAGEIISRFEKRNLNITHMKVMDIHSSVAAEHYAHVSHKPFFGEMIGYITSGPVVVLIIEGDKVIQTIRNMIGKTSPIDSLPGTIRGDYCSDGFENIIHASDTEENAKIEIERFFPELN